MATTATKVFPFALRKQMLPDSAAMQRAQFRISQNGGKEIPCRLHRPNKNVARKCRYAGGRTMQMGRRGYVGATLRREKFSRYWYSL